MKRLSRPAKARRGATRGVLAAIAILAAGCGGSGGGGGWAPAASSASSASGVTSSTSSSSSTPTATGTSSSTSSSSSSSSGTATSGSTAGTTTARSPSGLPIDHVFIIFKENHTFDNYFATFPGANGATTAIDSKGNAVPLKPNVTELDAPGSNGWSAARTDWNNGKMDQFDIGEAGTFYGLTWISTGPFRTWAPANGQPGGLIKYYWQIAQQGALCDNYFTSVMGCSSPNHMFSFAAQCANLISNEDLATHLWTVLDANGNQVPHPSHFTAGEVPTSLANELEKKGLTWKYFAENQGGGRIGALIAKLEDNDASIKGLDVVTALPSFATRYDDKTAQLDTNLAALLAQGNCGNVTWIKPAPFQCEHPGIGPVGLGTQWTRAIVNAIGQSQYWGRCAILITYDDFGGFYDHVPPPQLDRLGLGFRVPCTIVSPYAKKGFIDHTQYEHASLCKFAERLFGISPMSPRDAQSADMTNAFDFKQKPRDFSEFHF